MPEEPIMYNIPVITRMLERYNKMFRKDHGIRDDWFSYISIYGNHEFEFRDETGEPYIFRSLDGLLSFVERCLRTNTPASETHKKVAAERASQSA